MHIKRHLIILGLMISVSGCSPEEDATFAQEYSVQGYREQQPSELAIVKGYLHSENHQSAMLFANPTDRNLGNTDLGIELVFLSPTGLTNFQGCPNGFSAVYGFWSEKSNGLVPLSVYEYDENWKQSETACWETDANLEWFRNSSYGHLFE